ncbi:hypothetical protein HK097_009546 [Rhizophlyctis rosea]|uniref:t-SNARE coiled-coil homology domain-containing protein n=1 Tax=Rhizophlyctis rosea TaxID=64517 RepID=A0AAD5S8U4_9FUNG|nr:hypothetical protein HK097_009546 [Rhizophlyctis rosea]
MASMRDAMRRLQIIYEACAPEAQEQKEAEKTMDEFTRLKKKVHLDTKNVRKDLKEREQMLSLGGTTTESAEKSYRIRIAIRQLKEDYMRMSEIVQKETRKAAKKPPKDPEQLKARQEILQLCQQHIEELENLEKRKFNDAYMADRADLMSGASRQTHYASGKGKGADEAPDPFTNTELPDIDVEDDLRKIADRNAEIDKDLDAIGIGVTHLKNIANEMGEELDRQNVALDDIEAGVDKALDHVDNLNIKMKKTLDGMMKGDRFMVNCVLMCILLALVAFVASQFTT